MRISSTYTPAGSYEAALEFQVSYQHGFGSTLSLRNFSSAVFPCTVSGKYQSKVYYYYYIHERSTIQSLL